MSTVVKVNKDTARVVVVKRPPVVSVAVARPPVTVVPMVTGYGAGSELLAYIEYLSIDGGTPYDDFTGMQALEGGGV